MKLITAALLSALSCYTELAAAATGYVLTHNPSTSPQDQPSDQRRTLSPETARLVLAQRAGVEDYHIEKALTSEEIEAINEYGYSTHLFHEDRYDHARLFVLTFAEEGDAEALAQKYSSFAVSPAPSAPETKSMFQDLSVQSGEPYNTWEEAMEHMRDATDIREMIIGDKPFILGLPIERIEFLLEQKLGGPMTVLLMPLTGADKTHWGSYSMPNTEFPLKKRQAEKPLSEVFETASQAAEAAPMSTPLTTFADQSSPLPGILPACFRSQADCETMTRNCTGHGKCRKLYHDRDAAKGQKGDCYSCQCSATKEDRGDGKVKTTSWGGPACQKKDVSIDFWLITLFSVGLIFLVSFAVGNLVSMGGEELPSVIGAGVSGPVRK